MNGRRLVYLDLEGTGVDPHSDRIVEFCFLEPGVRQWIERVNPGRPIPAEAPQVHAIYDADVQELPPFREHAAKVQELIEGAVLVGYSLRRYDTILLHRELRMAGQPGLELDAHGAIVQPEIDLFGIWQRVENRKLATAAKRFAGVDLEDAHSAGADTRVLPAVLDGMLEAFGIEANVERLCELSQPEGAIDRDGKFVRDDQGVVRFNFAKVRGQPVHSDPGFLSWMLARDFSPETLKYARQFLDECYSDQGALGF